MKKLMLVVMVVSLIVGCYSVSYSEVKKETGLIDTSNPREALKIESTTWVADGWGFAKWKIKIKNNSTNDWKDILIKIVYFGESGTKIYSSAFDYTRYVIIPSGKSILIVIDNVGCPDQAVRGRVKIVRATLCE